MCFKLNFKQITKDREIADSVTTLLKNNAQWRKTMIRCKDPSIAVPFYETHFGFKLLHRYDIDLNEKKLSFKFYFVFGFFFCVLPFFLFLFICIVWVTEY